MKGAIFDLDGTLLDSMGWWETLGVELLRSFGLTPPPGLKRAVRGMTILQMVELLQRELDIALPKEQILEEIDRRALAFYQDEVCLKKGALSLLQALYKSGVRMCLTTASNRLPTEAALKRNGILSMFEMIFTCTEEGVDKTQGDIYFLGTRALGTPKGETLIFEDAPHAILTAKGEGFPVVGVYEPYFEQEQSKIRDICDYYIDMNQEGLFQRYFAG